MMRKLSWSEFDDLCKKLWESHQLRYPKITKVYGVPVGGWFVARRFAQLGGYQLTSDPNPDDTLIVDDIIDSGRTALLWTNKGFNFSALISKCGAKMCDPPGPAWLAYECNASRSVWIRFPYEAEREIEDSVRRILEYIGEDPNREGLVDTPARIVRSWEKLYGGYGKNPLDVIKLEAQFSEHANYDQIIVLKNIEFFSTCEHHMIPFYGHVHIGYLPDTKVAGISKLARMVELFARRLQLQERLTQQIADGLVETLQPRGVGVVVEGQHLCMMARGVEKRESSMVTSAMKGVFLTEEKPKSEFLRLIGR